MLLTITQSKGLLDEWRIEVVLDGDGEVLVTLFSGASAKQRAHEYADWKYPECCHGGA